MGNALRYAGSSNATKIPGHATTAWIMGTTWNGDASNGRTNELGSTWRHETTSSTYEHGRSTWRNGRTPNEHGRSSRGDGRTTWNGSPTWNASRHGLASQTTHGCSSNATHDGRRSSSTSLNTCLDIGHVREVKSTVQYSLWCEKRKQR